MTIACPLSLSGHRWIRCCVWSSACVQLLPELSTHFSRFLWATWARQADILLFILTSCHSGHEFGRTGPLPLLPTLLNRCCSSLLCYFLSLAQTSFYTFLASHWQLSRGLCFTFTSCDHSCSLVSCFLAHLIGIFHFLASYFLSLDTQWARFAVVCKQIECFVKCDVIKSELNTNRHISHL